MDTSGSDYYQGGPGPNILDIPALMDMPPFQGGGAGGGGGAAGPMGPPGPNNFGGKTSFIRTVNTTVFVNYIFVHFDRHFDGQNGCASRFAHHSVRHHLHNLKL